MSDDERFFVSVDLTRSMSFVLVTSQSKMSSEVRYLRADSDRGQLSVVMARREGVEYDVDHAVHPVNGDVWLVRCNRGPTGDELENFALFTLPMGQDDPASLRPLLPYRPAVKIETVDAFARHVLILERSDGLEHLRVLRLADGAEHVVAQPEPAYKLSAEASREWDTDVARFGYSSLTITRLPASVTTTWRAACGRRVKQATVGWRLRRRRRYRQRTACGPRLLTARLRRSPLVCRRDQSLDGSAPCLLYGYGSYEYPIDPSFSQTRLNLLERGFVFAIAHVRGGGELGRPWYEQGRLMHKKNTFSDFIACAERLVDGGWTSPDRLVIRGGSAGGLLMETVTKVSCARSCSRRWWRKSRLSTW